MHDDVERAITALQNAAQGLNLAVYRTHIHTLINAAQAYERQAEQLAENKKHLIAETHNWREAVAVLENKLATIRAMATRSVPNCINLDAIDRILNEPVTPTTDATNQ